MKASAYPTGTKSSRGSFKDYTLSEVAYLFIYVWISGITDKCHKYLSTFDFAVAANGSFKHFV
ncbi:MAG: hypothetical protein ACRKGH_08985 [Dehalogenimonas sp.]